MAECATGIPPIVNMKCDSLPQRNIDYEMIGYVRAVSRLQDRTSFVFDNGKIYQEVVMMGFAGGWIQTDDKISILSKDGRQTIKLISRNEAKA